MTADGLAFVRRHYSSSSTSTGAQPKGLATNGSTTYLATAKEVQVLSSGSKTSTLALPSASSSPLCIAASADGALVAVGTEDLKTLVYDAKNLKLLGTIELRAAPSALAFSHDGKHLAVGLSTGKIPLCVSRMSELSGNADPPSTSN